MKLFPNLKDGKMGFYKILYTFFYINKTTFNFPKNIQKCAKQIFIYLKNTQE